MSRLVPKIALAAAALALFAYVQPRLTMHVLAESLHTSDESSIRERMDAERVRESLRSAYLARLDHEPDEADRNAAKIASLALFGRGLEMLMATTDHGEGPRARYANWTYDSIRQARAVLEHGDAPSITLVLERQRATWQLVAMQPSEDAWYELDGSVLRRD
jgi:hypothetical protein